MAQLLPLVSRVIAGLLALVCCAGVLIYGIAFIYVIAWGDPWMEILGVQMTGLSSAVVCIACFVVAVALTAFAIRGESSPTEGSEHESAGES